MRTLLRKLASDDRGGEIIEYALIGGLIVIGAIAAITAIGGKVLARWNTIQNSM